MDRTIGDDPAETIARGWAAPVDPDATLPPPSQPWPLGAAEVATLMKPSPESATFSLHLGAGAEASRGSSPGPMAFSIRCDPMPEVGALIGGFRLLGILGQGAFARVYIAEQVDLGHRRVALKVSEPVGDEPQTLARLQHAHIVPIHSVFDDPVSGLRLMCMPYLGGANLAEILRSTLAAAGPSAQTTGRSLIAAIDRAGSSGDAPGSSSGRARSRGGEAPPAEGVGTSIGPIGARSRPSASIARSLLGRALHRLATQAPARDGPRPPGEDVVDAIRHAPARRYLESHSYLDSVLWLVARLAEGLAHAHDHGFLHRDLKPSNILIAADGTPMILDFNLSADIERPRADDEPANIGGTLPYMAPEHLQAFDPRGETPPEVVDARSDIYALGLILFEMAVGRPPFAHPEPGGRMVDVLRRLTDERLRGAPSARSWNPGVSWGLDSILRLCLAPDPAARYQSAADLAEDLRRLLDDRPLKFAPEPSVRERLAKWGRRNPRLSGAGPIAAASLGVLLLLGSIGLGYRERLRTAAARGRLQEFREAFGRCQLLLNTVNGPSGHLGRGLALVDRELARYRVDRPGVDWLAAPAVARLAEGDRSQLRAEIAELMLLSARARVSIAAAARSEPGRHAALVEAVRRLDLAESIDPRPSAALFDDRARDLAALGEKSRAAADRRRARDTPITSARDHYLMGTSRLALGDRDLAEASLSRAVAAEPRRFWAWFALGLCHLEQGRAADAAGDFGAATVIAPEFAWPHLNRGLALARTGRLVEARASYDRAVAADPDLAEARVNRALALMELGEPGPALADLDRVASASGRRPDAGLRAARAECLSRLGRRADAESEFALALRIRPGDATTLVARGFSRIVADPAGARADFGRVLAADPAHARARLGRAILTRSADPAAALVDVEAALRADPGLDDARPIRGLLRARLGDVSAVSDAEDLLRTPTPHRLYNAACVLSILSGTTGDPRHLDRAQTILDRSIADGFDPAQAARDPDLEPLRARRQAPRGG